MTTKMYRKQMYITKGRTRVVQRSYKGRTKVVQRSSHLDVLLGAARCLRWFGAGLTGGAGGGALYGGPPGTDE